MGSCVRAGHLVTPVVGLANRMKVLVLLCVVVVQVQLEKVLTPKLVATSDHFIKRARKIRIPLIKERQKKSLLNSFPFNAQEHGEHEHHDHHGYNGEHADHEHGDHHTRTAHSQDTPLLARQGYGEESEQNSPDFSSVAESGKKCVQKVMMVEETVWEDHETCDHSYDKRCHKSYTTTYQSQQEEECDEVFRKICYIEMVNVAHN